MQKLNISLVTLGQQKEPIDVGNLQTWKSRIFTICHAQHIEIAPDTDGHDWSYSDNLLRHTVKPGDKSDITVVIVSSPLENNYYSRRLGDGVCVISLHEMASITRSAHFPIENFILRSIYGYAIYHHAYGSVPPNSDGSWAHHATRRCIFDLNGIKEDIVYSLHKPRLCEACLAKLRTFQIPPELVDIVKAELPRLKKGTLYRLIDWANEFPGRALAVGVLTSLLLNIVANYIYDHPPNISSIYRKLESALTKNLPNE